jgi:hypothetical protein
MMAEKGFLDAEITHDTTAALGGHPPMAIKVTIQIKEGERSKRSRVDGVRLSPAERCAR